MIALGALWRCANSCGGAEPPFCGSARLVSHPGRRMIASNRSVVEEAVLRKSVTQMWPPGGRSPVEGETVAE